MFKSLKKVLSVSLVAAALFTACNPNAGIDANVSENNVDSSRSIISEVVTKSVRIRSDLNPGFGKAVYFTGTYNEDTAWVVAVRGSYDNGWYLDVRASGNFEWKALTGDYDLGESVLITDALTWESGENHFEEVTPNRVYVLSNPGYAKYGATCYFTGTFDGANNWQTAVSNETFSWSTYKWYTFVTSESGNFEWKALTGFGGHGDRYNAPFEGLNWVEGENKTQDDALSFSEYWAQTALIDFFEATYNAEIGKLTFNGTGCIYGFNGQFQNTDATIIEINNNGKVVYTGNYNDVRDTGIAFDKFDYSIYTVKLYPVSIYGDVGLPVTSMFSPAMVKVNWSSFTMGSDEDADTENAAHHVSITRPYYIGRYEVTDAEFKDIFGRSSSYMAYKLSVTDNNPAICLSFPFAIAYCNLRSIKEGLDPVYTVEGVDFENVTFDYLWNLKAEDKAKWNNPSVDWNANGYRLPTEAEWECAARNPSPYEDTKYSGSRVLSDVGVTMYTNYFRPVDVASLAANLRGIYDMSGNAEEWVWDFYAPYSTDDQVDPVCNSGEYHVVRGGGFTYHSDDDFTVYKREAMKGGYSSCTGLRVVRNNPGAN